MSSPNIVYVSDSSFEQDVLNASKPVLVDYWAEWCGPCRMIAPILDEVSTEYNDRLTVAKLDVDANQSTSVKYGIRGVPTLMLFEDGIRGRHPCWRADQIATHGVHRQQYLSGAVQWLRPCGDHAGTENRLDDSTAP